MPNPYHLCRTLWKSRFWPCRYFHMVFFCVYYNTHHDWSEQSQSSLRVSASLRDASDSVERKNFDNPGLLCRKPKKGFPMTCQVPPQVRLDMETKPFIVRACASVLSSVVSFINEENSSHEATPSKHIPCFCWGTPSGRNYIPFF